MGGLFFCGLPRRELRGYTSAMARYMGIITACLGWALCVLFAGPALAEEAAAEAIAWKTLAPGLEMVSLSAEESVRAGSGTIDILRIDPDRYDFRILAAPRGAEGHNAEEWLERSGAEVVVNAGQYLPDGSYIGLLVRDGMASGRLASRLEGLFVAGPEDDSLARARVLDLRYTAYDPQRSPYRQAAQSLMLLDRFGQIRVRRSARVAHRTAVAQDRKNRILFIVTQGGHTLWELADFLKQSRLGLREVMCMDGGQESQLAIKLPQFKYSHFGGPSASPQVPLPWPAPPLPAALAVYPRKARK